MKAKTFFLTAGIVFLLVAFLHLLRLLFGWQANIGGWQVPMWLSAVAVVVAGFLSYNGFRLSR